MEETGRGDMFSILNLRGGRVPGRVNPAYFQDLNLEQVLDLLAMEGGKTLRQYFYTLPETAEETAWRREIYGDVKKPEIHTVLQDFVRQAGEAADLGKETEKVSDPRQKAVWILRAIEAYGRACGELASGLTQAGPASAGLRRFLEILQGILGSESFRRMRQETEEVMGRIRGLRMVITYEKDRITVEPGTAPGIYGPLEKQGAGIMRNPFSGGPRITELENSVLDILIKKQPDFFRRIVEVSGRWTGYENPVISAFEKEIRFYLAFLSLQRTMEAKGFRFAVPETGERTEARGLYDLVLACASLKSGRKVVANDVEYREGERFFVLTGPNQGGKTTFARSLGQLIYFARIGVDVPAEWARVPFYPDIQSHFSVEESVDTGRGKLKEELVRLAPMMEMKQRGTFVVINELFTTAASYDAEIMGRRVLEHFIALGCTGIYVTHLQELSRGIAGAADLHATLDGNRNPTFEIRRGSGTEGACAENLVNKYRLTYDQLKERL